MPIPRRRTSICPKIVFLLNNFSRLNSKHTYYYVNTTLYTKKQSTFIVRFRIEVYSLEIFYCARSLGSCTADEIPDGGGYSDRFRILSRSKERFIFFWSSPPERAS